MKKFFNFLQDVEVKELSMTQGVLRERKRLEGCVYNLLDAIKMEELKQNELMQTQKSLKKSREECETQKDLSIEVDEPYKEMVRIKPHWWKVTKKAMCCSICEENCHYPGCWWVKALSKCSVMKDGNCTVCSKKCPVSAHVRQRFIYVPKTKKVKKHLDLTESEKQVKAIRKEIKERKKKIYSLLNEACQCIKELEEKALRMDVIPALDHLDFLIEKLKETGCNENIEILEKIRTKHRASQAKRGAYRRADVRNIHPILHSTQF